MRAPSEKDAVSTSLEKRLWDAADQFRGHSGLKRQEHSSPALSLLFLRFTERVRRRRPHGYELYPECFCP